MARDDDTPTRVRWARLRFSIIGPLLASPAEGGDLKRRIEELALRSWKHPQTGDAIAALARKVHARAGTHPSVLAPLAEAIARQHAEHPRWTYQLHYDNLLAL